MPNIRDELVRIALEWEKRFSVCPSITSSISEYDAAMLLGCDSKEYEQNMRGRTSVSKGFDFTYGSVRYQIKANRPSGKKGSKVTLVSQAKNYEFDFLIWILYDTGYNMVEAWKFSVNDYKQRFETKNRLSPDDMRHGQRLI